MELVGRDGRVDGVVLRDGERLQCDMVVFAIGVRPNVGLIRPMSGIHVNRGIVVDHYMRTTRLRRVRRRRLRGGLRLPAGHRPPHRHLAERLPAGSRGRLQHGRRRERVRREIPDELGGSMRRADDLGRADRSAGRAGKIRDLEYIDRETPVYKKLVLRDNRLVGAICVGNIERAGIYTGLIRDRADISRLQGPSSVRQLRPDLAASGLPQAPRSGERDRSVAERGKVKMTSFVPHTASSYVSYENPYGDDKVSDRLRSVRHHGRHRPALLRPATSSWA